MYPIRSRIIDGSLFIAWNNSFLSPKKRPSGFDQLKLTFMLSLGQVFAPPTPSGFSGVDPSVQNTHAP